MLYLYPYPIGLAQDRRSARRETARRFNEVMIFEYAILTIATALVLTSVWQYSEAPPVHVAYPHATAAAGIKHL